MKYLRVVNLSNQRSVAERVRVASSLLQRTIGLLGTPSLALGEGLWLKPCKSVHTYFMRYPIDVLFLDQSGTVLFQDTLPPWKISPWQARAQGVLEVSSGTLAKTQTLPGHRLALQEIV